MPFVSLFDPVLDRVMATTHSREREPNLFDETLFALKVTFKGKIPGMFTRDNKSNFFVDMFWASTLFFISLVYAGARLQELRSTLTISISGYDPRYQADFKEVDANLLGYWLSDHPEGATKAIDGANAIIHFLAYIVDPLPEFISQPSTMTLHLAKVAILYCAYRFLILHRQWRFNFLLPHVSYAVLSLALWWVYSVDPWLALFAAAFWCFPTIIAMTVLLHELLGDNAWKTRDSLNGSYTAHDLWADLEKKLYSPSMPSSGFFSPTPKPMGPGYTLARQGRVYTLLDEEDSDGELEAREEAFTKLLELNRPEGGDRRKRNTTPCSTPILS